MFHCCQRTPRNPQYPGYGIATETRDGSRSKQAGCLFLVGLLGCALGFSMASHNGSSTANYAAPVATETSQAMVGAPIPVLRRPVSVAAAKMHHMQHTTLHQPPQYQDSAGSAASAILVPTVALAAAAPWLVRQYRRASWTTMYASGTSDISNIRPYHVGTPGTPEFTVYLKDGEDIVSPWHDIPHHDDGNGVFYFINEIPKGTTAKMEVSTKIDQNPIKQDSKNGKLRHLTYDMGRGSVGIPFNYGMLPRTFEDPTAIHEDTGAYGDADPIDVVEISDTSFQMGEIRAVKVLGCLAMIDEGETDWKVIAIGANHPRAASLHSIEDLSTPEDLKLLSEVRQWFQKYKTADGKPENAFAFEGQFKGRDYTLRIIEEVHSSYNQLLSGELANSKGWAIPSNSAASV